MDYWKIGLMFKFKIVDIIVFDCLIIDKYCLLILIIEFCKIGLKVI